MTYTRKLIPIVCITLCVVALSYDIAGYPLLDPDEGRNAEIAREMASTNNFILPHLNGVPYVDKPVLYFATVAVFMKVLGPTVLAARLPSLLFTFLTLGVVFLFGRKVFGTRAAWIATIATAATPFSVAYSRTVIFDSMLTFLIVLAIASFFMAIETSAQAPAKSPRDTGSDWWMSMAWSAMALGVLTKGPIALALPLMVAIPYAIRRKALRSLGDALSVLLFVALDLPWVMAVSRHVPDFLHYVVVTETIGRLTTDELHRTGPFWYFLIVLPAASLPWSLVLLGGLWRGRPWRKADGRLDDRVMYLLLWIVVPLIFFSFSQSKRPQYVLPLVPAVGLLLGSLWTTVHKRAYGARIAAVIVGAMGAVLMAAQKTIPELVPAGPAIAAAIPSAAALIGASSIVAAVIAYFWSRDRKVLLLALSLPIVTIPLVSRTIMDEIGSERSAANIAKALGPRLSPDVQVIGVHAFPPSLPFYLQRPLILSTDDGSELTSNYIVRHLDHWTDSSVLRGPDWWREALIRCTQPRVFVVKSNDDDARQFLAQQLDLVIDTGKYAVYGPCGFSNLAAAK